MTQSALLVRLSLLALIPLLGKFGAADTVAHARLDETHRAAKPNVVNVNATEFAFEMPDTIPAGLTTFELHNHGKLLHHLSMARLDSGKTEGDAVEEMVRLGRNLRPAWMTSIGGPNGAMPGQSTNATISLAPGRYFAYCEIPGPDPARHYMKGMLKAFVVTSSSSVEVIPSSDLKIGLADYAFLLSKPLTRGHHVIAITNGSLHPHMVAFKRYPIGYPAGTAANELAAWALNPQGKPSPGYSVGGVTEIGPAGVAIVEGDFEPGMYLLMCFSASPNGTPHFRLGMQKEITVK